MPTDEPLPYVCPDHPMAQVKHSWDQSHYIIGGYPAGLGFKTNHAYACNECGRHLRGEP